MNAESPYSAPIPDLSSRESIARYQEAFSDWWKRFLEAEYSRYRNLIGPTIDSYLNSQSAALEGLKHSDPLCRQAALFVLENAFEKSAEIVNICEALIEMEPDEAVRIGAKSYIEAYHRSSEDKKPGFTDRFWRFWRYFT